MLCWENRVASIWRDVRLAYYLLFLFLFCPTKPGILWHCFLGGLSCWDLKIVLHYLSLPPTASASPPVQNIAEDYKVLSLDHYRLKRCVRGVSSLWESPGKRSWANLRPRLKGLTTYSFSLRNCNETEIKKETGICKAPVFRSSPKLPRWDMKEVRNCSWPALVTDRISRGAQG